MHALESLNRWVHRHHPARHFQELRDDAVDAYAVARRKNEAAKRTQARFERSGRRNHFGESIEDELTQGGE